MSIFDDAQSANSQPQEAQTSETTQQETQPQESYLQKLVETRGENWTDPEVLAKGKLEADAYIKNLEDQLAAMREDLGKQDYASQLLKQLEGKASAPTNDKPLESNNTNDNGGTNTEDHTSLAVSEDSLKSLVEKTLTEREQQATANQNIAAVDQALQDSYGTEAASVVKKKSEELGIGLERMQQLASESPSAFFALIGEPQKTFKPMTQGSVRTEGLNNQSSSQRDWSYYQKLRRENRNLYYTPKVQQQLMEDKMRMGDKFGN